MIYIKTKQGKQFFFQWGEKKQKEEKNLYKQDKRGERKNEYEK